MRQTVARQRVIQEGVSQRELARLAIGFVDLVGSTRLPAGLDPAALAEPASRFEARARAASARSASISSARSAWSAKMMTRSGRTSRKPSDTAIPVSWSPFRTIISPGASDVISGA